MHRGNTPGVKPGSFPRATWSERERHLTIDGNSHQRIRGSASPANALAASAFFSKAAAGLGLGFWFGLALLLTACNGYKAVAPKNFTSALDAYYSAHDDCLYSSALRFPYEEGLATRDASTRALDALTDAGLLQRTEEQGIQVKRYSLTPYATNHLDPRFCYGHRVITSIDSFTPPAGPHGQQTSQVSYHYRVEDLASWAKSKQMLAAFPALRKVATGESSDTTTLLLTVNGWRVPE